jgi:DNA-directed RNA polymerase subunit RPC12/RpoP
MGEIAEMMLDGTLCEGCGCTNRKGGEGFPWRCVRCQADKPESDQRKTPTTNSTKVACPTCGRRVKRAGLSDHVRDTHSGLETK